MRAGLARDVLILRRANPSAPEATGAAFADRLRFRRTYSSIKTQLLTIKRKL